MIAVEDPELAGIVSADNIHAVTNAFIRLLTKRLGSPDTPCPGNCIGEALMDLGIANGGLNVFSYHLRSALKVMAMPQKLLREILSKV